jgi:hypothetical protein
LELAWIHWVSSAHNNFVAVAALLELSAGHHYGGAMPDVATLKKGQRRRINLLSSSRKVRTRYAAIMEMGIYS